MFEVFAWNANTVIRDGNGDAFVCTGSGNSYFRFSGGIFQSVVQQVDKNIQEVGFVNHNNRVRGIKGSCNLALASFT